MITVNDIDVLQTITYLGKDYAFQVLNNAMAALRQQEQDLTPPQKLIVKLFLGMGDSKKAASSRKNGKKHEGSVRCTAKKQTSVVDKTQIAEEIDEIKAEPKIQMKEQVAHMEEPKNQSEIQVISEKHIAEPKNSREIQVISSENTEKPKKSEKIQVIAQKSEDINTDVEQKKEETEVKTQIRLSEQDQEFMRRLFFGQEYATEIDAEPKSNKKSQVSDGQNEGQTEGQSDMHTYVDDASSGNVSILTEKPTENIAEPKKTCAEPKNSRAEPKISHEQPKISAKIQVISEKTQVVQNEGQENKRKGQTIGQGKQVKGQTEGQRNGGEGQTFRQNSRVVTDSSRVVTDSAESIEKKAETTEKKEEKEKNQKKDKKEEIAESKENIYIIIGEPEGSGATIVKKQGETSEDGSDPSALIGRTIVQQKAESEKRASGSSARRRQVDWNAAPDRPTYEQVVAYFNEKRAPDAKGFFDYWEEKEWIDPKDGPIQGWKRRAATWIRLIGVTIPTYQQIKKFFDDRGFESNPREFQLENESRGWKMGNTWVKNWQSSAELFERRRAKANQPKYQRL